MAWASKTDPNVVGNFTQNIGVAFSGLPLDGNVDSTVDTSSAQYKSFANSMQKTCTASGKDSELANQINREPQSEDVYDTYVEWAGPLQDGSIDVTRFSLDNIWSALDGVQDPDLKSRAEDVRAAYEWITTHPRIYKSPCRLEIQSDWGDMNLLTPSAWIDIAPETTLPEGAYWSSTKIGWRDPANPRTGQTHTLE